MRFPPARRVVYEKTSLVEVICQLRFPPILKIDSDPVSDFQERVRSALPGYDRRALGHVQAPVIIAGGTPVMVPQLSDQRVEHAFLSADGSAKVTLGRDFVAYTTQAYDRWESFKRTLQLTVDAVSASYGPAWATRVGLRYQNVIRRSRLGMQDQPWGALLRSSVLGLLGDSTVNVDHALREDAFPLDVGSQAGRGRVFHGLVMQEEEQCYLLDTDFFVEDVVTWPNVPTVLDELHQQSWHCFRYFTTEKLHQAMRPGIPE